MNRLRYFFIWLSRITHSRGFGIQSPGDYSFVRYVVNEHWPYYKYEELAVGQEDWLSQKLGRLYFRLANWRQPAVIVDAGRSPYWKAGCRHAIVTAELQPADIIKVHLTANTRQTISSVLDNADENTLLIIENIWQEKALWKKVIQDPRTTVSFDLFLCGLVTFDKKREKRNYIINF